MASHEIDIIEYGSGLAIAVVELADGAEVLLKRPATGPVVWEARMDMYLFSDIIDPDALELELDITRDPPAYRLVRPTPNEALEAIREIYEEQRK